MKLNFSPRRQKQTANTLIVTLITMAVVGVFVDLAMQYTNSVGRNVQRDLLLRQATNIGDATTEMAFASWRAICRTNQTTIFTTSAFTNAVPTPTPGDFPGVSNYTLANCHVYPLDSTWNTKTAATATPAPISGPNHADLSYYYLASADVIIPTLNSKNATDPNDPGNVVARVRRVFQKQNLSLFKYAIFYDDSMEIHPGPPMVVTGDVHTNGSLYTGHSSLTLLGNTTYSNTWTIGFMPGDSTHPETPTSPSWGTGQPPSVGPVEQPFGIQLSDYHQLIDYTTTPTSLDPYRFQTQAGLVVTIDASNTVKVYDKTGTDITSQAKGIAVKNAITTNQTITDNREGATTGNGSIRLASLDVGALTTSVNSGTFGASWNGILYIVDTSASSDGITSKRGIRLKNGATLPTSGLTVASANPIYVQGDYNTGTVGATQPPSNSGDPTQPTVGGYTRKAAAIIGDAINVLSNSWLDSLSGTVPNATSTTVNAAFVSGIVPTGNGYYSGGVENFPRFLENWSSSSFTYYGSMIELYKSQQNIGHWGASNVYSPPTRAWYFDTNFLSSPPPGLLAAFNYIRSRWYMQ